MERTQELEIVNTAYFLEDRLLKLEDEKKELQSEKPQKPTHPEEPVEEFLKIEPKPYPEITPSIERKRGVWKRGAYIWGGSILLQVVSIILGTILPSLTFLTLLSGILSLGPIAGIVIIILDYMNEKKNNKIANEQYKKAVENSTEYRQKCEVIYEENRIRQAQADKETHEKYIQRFNDYQKLCKQYEENMVEYKELKIPEWTESVNELQSVIQYTEDTLREVYGKNILPQPYRNIHALLYISSFLNASAYDLKYAIERYDTYVMQVAQREQINISKAQLEVSEEVLQNQQYANYLNEQLCELTEQGNQTLKSISNWQKADIAIREYRRHKLRKGKL